MLYKKLNKLQLTYALLTSIAIFLFYLLFNFNYISNFIDERGDVKTYDYYVKLGLPEYLYNPHHIGFDWLGKQFYNKLVENGYTGSSMRVLQLRNLLVSSLFLSILFFLLYKFSKKYILSILLVSVISFCAAFWMYSQINDTPIIHSCLVCLLFFATINFRYAKNKYIYATFLGLLHSVNIFFHQYDILFTCVIFFVLVLSDIFIKDEYLDKLTLEKDKSLRFLKNVNIDVIKKNIVSFQNFKLVNLSGLRYFSIYLIVFIITVSSAYYYVGMIEIGLTLNKAEAKDFNKIKDASYFFNWLILYTKINYWGKGFENKNLLNDVSTGISTYFYQPITTNDKNQTPPVSKNDTIKKSILPNTSLIFVFAILIIAILLSFELYKKYNYIFLAILLFLFIYTVFSCWWEPGYREFWVATMFCFWILVFFILNFIIDRLQIIKPLPQLIIYLFLFVFTGLLFYTNFIVFIYPNSSFDYRIFDIILK